MKYLKYWKAILIGLVIGYVGFLNLRLWYHGLDLNPISLYSYKPSPYFAEYTKKWKKTKTEVFPCVTVVGKRLSGPSPTQHTSQTLPSVQGQPQNDSFHLDGIQLGEWNLKPLFYGGIAQVQLDSSGVSHLEVTPNAPHFLELGKQRALGLSVGYPLLSQNRQLQYSIYLYQDLLRIGPVWIRGQIEADNNQTIGTDLSLQLKAEVRF